MNIYLAKYWLVIAAVPSGLLSTLKQNKSTRWNTFNCLQSSTQSLPVRGVQGRVHWQGLGSELKHRSAERKAEQLAKLSRPETDIHLTTYVMDDILRQENHWFFRLKGKETERREESERRIGQDERKPLTEHWSSAKRSTRPGAKKPQQCSIVTMTTLRLQHNMARGVERFRQAWATSAVSGQPGQLYFSLVFSLACFLRWVFF